MDVNELTLPELDELQRLRLDNARLRAEAAELRKRINANGWTARIAQRAADDAMLFIADLHRGLSVSRLAMDTRHGMSRRRWEYARALLAAARVANRWYRVTVFDAAAVQRAIDAAAKRAAEDGDVIVARLPPGRVRERRYHRATGALRGRTNRTQQGTDSGTGVPR